MGFYNNGVDWVNDAFPECKFTQAVSWYCYEHDDECPGAKFIIAEIWRLAPMRALTAAGMTRGECDCFNEGLICIRDEDEIISFGYCIDTGKIDYYYNHDYVRDYDTLMACLPGIYRRFIDFYNTRG